MVKVVQHLGRVTWSLLWVRRTNLLPSLSQSNSQLSHSKNKQATS